MKMRRVSGPPRTGGEQRADHGGERADRRRVAEDGQERDRFELRAARAGDAAGGVRGAECAARAEQVGAEPQQRDDRGGRDHGAAILTAAPEPDPVEPEKRPGLGAHQGGGGRAGQRGAGVAGQVRDHRPEHGRAEQALRVAERGVEQPPGRQRHRGHGRRSRPATREPRPEHVRAPQGQQPSGAGDDHPQRGRGLLPQGEHHREQHRERLPGRPGGGVEREPTGLAAPDEPRERVERQCPREQQRERGDHDGGSDRRGRSQGITCCTR